MKPKEWPGLRPLNLKEPAMLNPTASSKMQSAERVPHVGKVCIITEVLCYLSADQLGL